MGSHTGRHPGIILQLLASKAGRFYLNDEYKFIRECVERGERILLLAFCISNRHRSVAFATCVGAAFWPTPAMVIHLDTYVDNNWETMRCGGRCDQCGERFQSAASATALHNQVISHLSPAALGPMKAQQVRQRSMPPDPAAHNFPRSSTPGPAAPLYHRLRAASVSGAGSSSDRRRPAEPPSTARATRATPPAPSASSAREIHDFTLDDPDHGVEYWKTRAIRAEAQTDMYKDELRMVRAEADALRERAAAAERELIIRCGDESDRSRSRSASRAPSRDPSLRPGRMGARQREENKIRKMLRDTGKTTVDRDGWFGPVGAGGNSGDVLFHNVRWWSRPRGGDSFRIKWDRSLDDHRKTVLLYKSGYVQVLDEDVAMQQLETRAPTNDRENQFLIIARPIPGPRSKLAFNSTYRGRDPGPSGSGPSDGQGDEGGKGGGKRGTSKDRRRSTLGPHGYVRYADINKRGRSSGPAQTRYNGERAVKPPSPPRQPV